MNEIKSINDMPLHDTVARASIAELKSKLNNIEDNEKRKAMYQAIDMLKDREKEIIKLRYGLDTGIEMTQKEVAEMLDISQSYISRLEKRIIKKLRGKVAK